MPFTLSGAMSSPLEFQRDDGFGLFPSETIASGNWCRLRKCMGDVRVRQCYKAPPQCYNCSTEA